MGVLRDAGDFTCQEGTCKLENGCTEEDVADCAAKCKTCKGPGRCKGAPPFLNWGHLSVLFSHINRWICRMEMK